MQGMVREGRISSSVEGEGGEGSRRGQRRSNRSSEKPSSISCS